MGVLRYLWEFLCRVGSVGFRGFYHLLGKFLVAKFDCLS